MTRRPLVVVVVLLLIVVAAAFMYRQKTLQNKQAPVEQNSISEQAEDKETSNYKLYSGREFENALNQNKVVVLYFAANWCPICREQEPINLEVMEGLEEDEEVVMFKVHILDNQTTDEGEKLAQKYAVVYQHTFVIIGSGEVVEKHTGPLMKDDLAGKITQAKEGGKESGE